MKSSSWTLRVWLLLWLLPPVAVLTCVWISATYTVVLRFADLAYDRALEDTVDTIAGQITEDEGSIAIDLPAAAQKMILFDRLDRIFYSVSDGSGRVIAASESVPPPPEATALGGTQFYNSLIRNSPVRVVERALSLAPTQKPLQIRVAETMRKREVLAAEALAYMIAPQALFLSGLMLLLWNGVGRGVAPINRVRDAISGRSHDDLTPLETKGLPTELREQVQVINDLMARLDSIISSQRRFIGDAAHQLRTPVAVIRTQAEMAVRATDLSDLRGIVNNLDDTSARLVRLAKQLLNLSRAEAGLAGIIDFTTIDFAELVTDTVVLLAPDALQKNIDLSVDIDPQIGRIWGDRDLLAEMISNLLDNAIRYTPRNGNVSVAVTQIADRAVLKISDDGPGISDSELLQVLKPFYRAPGTVGTGSGIGLTIANDIASIHEGSLTLSRPPNGNGLRVSIELPIRVNRQK